MLPMQGPRQGSIPGGETIPHAATKTWCSQIDVRQVSRSVVSNSLRPHGLQHTRLPCPYTNPQSLLKLMSIELVMPSNHLIVYVPFSSCTQSSPGSFPMSQFFASGGQSIGVSASASVLPVNIQDWFPLEWTGWISLQSMGLSRVFSNTIVQKHQFFGTQLSLWSNPHSHPYMTTGKTIAFTRQTAG